MYKTENEILSQYEALELTYNQLLSMEVDIRRFFNSHQSAGITFIGCGSSYSLCKSAEISAKMRMNKKFNSIAAGDLLVNFPSYSEMIKDTLLVVLSRSGSTSEVVLAVKRAKEEMGLKLVSICTREGAELGRIADFSIEIPWAFDESVCQTRTITNFYMASLLFIATVADDRKLTAELKLAVEAGKSYMNTYKDKLKCIAENNLWKKVFVLADSELEGIAEEGALAFNEICRIPSNYYHMLDVRHGPIVLVNDETLVILACSPLESSYQSELVNDLKKRGAFVLTVSGKKAEIWGSDFNVDVQEYENFSVTGIPFIFVPQALSYFKAVALGVNPDEPEGLDPWIRL